MIGNMIQKSGFIGILFIIIACNVPGGKSAGQASLPQDTLSFTGCQKILNLKVGSVVELRLEIITGTGYQWVLKEPSPLVEQLEQDVMKFVTPGEKEGMPGQQAYQILRFKALKEGSAEIQLDYKRTFEAGIEKSCIMKIVVK